MMVEYYTYLAAGDWAGGTLGIVYRSKRRGEVHTAHTKTYLGTYAQLCMSNTGNKENGKCAEKIFHNGINQMCPSLKDRRNNSTQRIKYCENTYRKTINTKNISPFQGFLPSILYRGFTPGFYILPFQGSPWYYISPKSKL